MTKLYILLGGNLGNKQQVFSETWKRLEKQIGPITKRSAVYETEPWGFESNDMFWNQAIEIETELWPDEVLTQTHGIEEILGRIRKENQFDSRIIDIDVLFYGSEIVNQPDLQIPHPRIQDRKFVLVPLCEIAPELVHPVFKKTVCELLSECSDQLAVKKLTIQNS
ncbi:MAG TPA: 2-amino-4-hydroxy-6-hydroxymethyldihydropteridine diphosphokinase [Prolixibacteraceae bacterium]|nr:2-amino-4-hydroxy-6-hydroxymethyldihydropteridine diphosphokinase [Prolixibacteraceae bacterium]HPR85060.1 2-amino-4-hydroxy-6-hydroxymethyldihydropteridine diphosphokinase [Prolixibacteraceae bacterium]